MLLSARLDNAFPGARSLLTSWLTSAAIAMASAAPLSAQDSRADEIAAKQREKAANLSTYKPNRVEAFLLGLEESFASPPNGFYPEFSSVYRGGGFTLGAGYRRFFARDAVWNARALYSIKNYKQVEIGARTPWFTNGRWTVDTRFGWLDAPQVAYYGQGMADGATRANFTLQRTYATALAEVRPSRWSRLIGEVSYDDYITSPGQGSAPSIETIYSPSDAPGLLADPAFLRTEGTAAIDWRPSAGYARKGGYYGVTLANYADRDDTYSFRRMDGEIVQHLPILRENWVVSLRGRVQSVLGDDDVVPYFLLPELGSGRTLRGYGSGRFRDRHSLLTSAEFRWIPNRTGLDFALFYDAGKVTSRREDLDFDSLKSDWGIGARFHGPTTTVLRIEGAKGTEGWRLVVSTGTAF
jgi:hypothetical protein